jgi:lipoprotein-releasing system permease protein
MAMERYIAARLRRSTPRKGDFSKIIVRIGILSISLSVCIMILSSSVVHGFKKQISEKIFDFWGHIHIIDAFVTQPFDPQPMQYDPAMVDSLYAFQWITYREPVSFLGIDLGTRPRRTKGGVKHVQQFVQYPGVISTKEDIEGIFLKGISDDFNRVFFEHYLEEGTPLVVTDTSSERELLISSYTSNRLKLTVDDEVAIYFVREGTLIPRRFTISGIYKTGLAEYDQKIAFTHQAYLQEILGWNYNQIGGLEVILDEIDDMDIANLFIYQEIVPSDIYTQTVKEKSRTIFDWLDLQDINEIIILGLMLIVCLVNLMTAMLILILERTIMIGILKALGAANWSVRKVFIYQAGFILSKGLMWGNITGFALCFFQKYFEVIKLKEEDYYLAVAPIEFNWWVILLINAGTLIITVLFLILPSHLISRVSPSEAIRFS